MTRKFYALLSSGDLVGFGTFEGFTQAWLEEPADAVFILDDQGLEKLRRQSAELLNQAHTPTPTPTPTLNYSKLEAELLPHLVTEVTVDGWTISVNMPELRGSFERDRNGLGGSLRFVSVRKVNLNRQSPKDAVELIDYDGVFALPRPVFKQLKAWGVVMDESFDPDYEVQP